jgi:hypothetical protein
MIESAKKQQGSMQESADSRFQGRVQEILNQKGGFDINDVAEGIRAEARLNKEGAMPITSAMYGNAEMDRDVRLKTSAENEELINQLKGMSGNVPLAEAMAGRRMPGAREAASRMGASVMGAMADEGMRGDIARVGAVSLGVGGITASGAALIDLMQFLSQGQEVDCLHDHARTVGV